MRVSYVDRRCEYASRPRVTYILYECTGEEHDRTEEETTEYPGEDRATTRVTPIQGGVHPRAADDIDRHQKNKVDQAEEEPIQESASTKDKPTTELEGEGEGHREVGEKSLELIVAIRLRLPGVVAFE